MNAKKIVTAGLALVMVAGISVAGTLAFLTDDTGPVTNSFSVGANVAIALDEAPVDENRVKTEGTRGYGNEYDLAPGGSYDKDPTVHVTGGDCWVFVTVVNPLESFEGNNKIADQMTAKGWVSLGETDGGEDLYGLGTGTGKGDFAASVVNSTNAANKVLFEKLTISDEISNEESAALKYDAFAAAAAEDIVIKAYAIQSENMDLTTALDTLGLVAAPEVAG